VAEQLVESSRVGTPHARGGVAALAAEKVNVNRIFQLEPAQAAGKTKPLFEAVQAKWGVVPNLFRVLGVSPAALEGYLHFDDALANGSLSPSVREQIALAVAEANFCSYCLSAHTFLGGKVGLTNKDIADARHAKAAAPQTDAILKLARGIVVQRGEVNDADLERVRAVGLTDEHIVETVANVALNIFANYVNHAARTVVDFPQAQPGNGSGVRLTQPRPAEPCGNLISLRRQIPPAILRAQRRKRPPAPHHPLK
jgi:uncharacterized peroxidase-related enzyme